MIRLTVFGAGNMGAAILGGAVKAGVLPPREILVVEPDPEKRAAMAALGCAVAASPHERHSTSTDPDSAAQNDSASPATILLAVKPQMFPALAESMGPLTRPTIALSIMAGLHSDSIRAALGPHARVIRAMPNTPSQLGAGMTAVALGAGAVPGDEALALRLFGAIGTVETLDEGLMHAVTAVSGSGPAYLFLLAEAMERSAAEVGFSPLQARTFVTQTLLGAAMLLAERRADPASLRAAVTSKGGTTEAAIAAMQRGGFETAVIAGIVAARNRGEALGASPPRAAS